MVVDIRICSVVVEIKGSVKGELRSKSVETPKIEERKKEKRRKEGATSKGQVLRVNFNWIKVSKKKTNLIINRFDKDAKELANPGEQTP